MEEVLVSACLLGGPVHYDGKVKTPKHGILALWQEEGRLIRLCLELAAYRPPRAPAELAPSTSSDAILGGHGSIYEKTGTTFLSTFSKAQTSPTSSRVN